MSMLLRAMFLLCPVALVACATTVPMSDDDTSDDDAPTIDAAVPFDAPVGQPDAPVTPPVDAAPGQPDAPPPPPPIDAAPPPPPDANTGPFCMNHNQCMSMQCCFKFPPNAPQGFCVEGEVDPIFGLCVPASEADAGPM